MDSENPYQPSKVDLSSTPISALDNRHILIRFLVKPSDNFREFIKWGHKYKNSILLFVSVATGLDFAYNKGTLAEEHWLLFALMTFLGGAFTVVVSLTAFGRSLALVSKWFGGNIELPLIKNIIYFSYFFPSSFSIAYMLPAALLMRPILFANDPPLTTPMESIVYYAIACLNVLLLGFSLSILIRVFAAENQVTLGRSILTISLAVGLLVVVGSLLFLLLALFFKL